MDDTYFGAPKPGKRGRGAAGKAKVVVAVETPTAKKPRFAAMRMVPRVSSAEIQPLVRERLATEAVIKTDGWQGYSFLDASPGVRHEWLVPGSGKEAPKVLPWVHTLIANIKGNIRGIHHGVSPKHLPRYLAEFCYRFNRASGNRKWLTVCFMLVSTLLPSLSRSIEGGLPLHGEVLISGAKNAALPILCATLLAPGEHRLDNVPPLADIRTCKRLLGNLGARFQEGTPEKGRHTGPPLQGPPLQVRPYWSTPRTWRAMRPLTSW